MTEALRIAEKLVRAPDAYLTPEIVGTWVQSAPLADVSYMLAHERHRRGLPVELVEAK